MKKKEKKVEKEIKGERRKRGRERLKEEEKERMWENWKSRTIKVVTAINAKQKCQDYLNDFRSRRSPPTVRKATTSTGVTPAAKKFRSGTANDASTDDTIWESRLNDLSPDENIKFKTAINNEMELFIQNSGWKTGGNPSLKSVQDLDFTPVIEFLKQNCPTLCLLFPQTYEGEPAIGQIEVTAVSILAFSRNSKAIKR